MNANSALPAKTPCPDLSKNTQLSVPLLVATPVTPRRPHRPSPRVTSYTPPNLHLAFTPPSPGHTRGCIMHNRPLTFVAFDYCLRQLLQHSGIQPPHTPPSCPSLYYADRSPNPPLQPLTNMSPFPHLLDHEWSFLIAFPDAGFIHCFFYIHPDTPPSRLPYAVPQSIDTILRSR